MRPDGRISRKDSAEVELTAGALAPVKPDIALGAVTTNFPPVISGPTTLTLEAGETRDSDVEGLRKLEREVKSVYAQRGAADRFAIHLTAGDHTYTEEMIEQVSQWFQRFLKRKGG